MNLKPFTGPGSTPSRRRFWNKVTQAVIASQKIAGRHVTVDEHQGMGTVINVDDTSARRKHPSGITGACCIDDECSILTEDDCATSGGHYLGDGSTCDGVVCGDLGICCRKGECHGEGCEDFCLITTEAECIDISGDCGDSYLQFSLFPDATCHDCFCFECCYDETCDGIFGC